MLAIDNLGLRHTALLQQQGAERVADRLHPAPRLVIGQVILQRDYGAKMREGRVVAIPRPMPDAAPVTIAVLPEMSMFKGPF